MKLLHQHLEKDKSGYIKLEAEEGEDMWHIYNLLLPGDLIKASTVRKVVTESSTGSTEKFSHRITLTIRAEDVFFDTQAMVLRVNGRNVEENQHVKMGAYHTIDLEANKPFTITKQEWNFIDLDRISVACDVTKRAEIAAIVMEEGIAHICLVTESMTIVRLKIESNVPRKRRGTSVDHDKGLLRY